MIVQFISQFASLSHAKEILDVLGQLGETFSSDYIKEGNARDAIIDSAIEYLESLKTKK